MGVEVELVGLIGLKLDYTKYQVYKNKNEDNYVYDKEDGRLNDIHCVFEDYFPENFISKSDYMGGEYVYIGKKIFVTRYIDVGVEVSLNPEELQKEVNSVIPDLKALGIKFEDKDVRVHFFTHFW
jgi:hypothetical protein